MIPKKRISKAIKKAIFSYVLVCNVYIIGAKQLQQLWVHTVFSSCRGSWCADRLDIALFLGWFDCETLSNSETCFNVRTRPYQHWINQKHFSTKSDEAIIYDSVSSWIKKFYSGYLDVNDLSRSF